MEKVKTVSAVESKLASSLKMGVTELHVANMARMKTYYKDIVGLDVLEENADSITLGYNDRAVIRLVRSSAPAAGYGSAGLYHNAIVYASRGELARRVQNVIDRAPESYSGTSDHIVSEAFYFTDPEGNGLELYYDKDPTTWKWVGDRVQMGSSYIDPHAYIQQYSNQQENVEKHMGHVHLKVGNIEEAKKFYVDVLGFNITAELGSALFVSVGGYHHHLGMNVWESEGAGKRTTTRGLKSFELILPDKQNIDELTQRLEENGVEVADQNGGIRFADPWNNSIIVRN